MDLLEEDVNKVAKGLGLTKDYATVLLVANEWDDKFVMGNYNNDLIKKSGIIEAPTFEEMKMFVCDRCKTVKDCKMYGCSHLQCQTCIKGNVPQQSCQNFNLFKGRLANDISTLVKGHLNYVWKNKTKCVISLLTALWGNTPSVTVLTLAGALIIKLFASDKILAVAVLSSATTALLILMAICNCIRGGFRFLLRRF